VEPGEFEFYVGIDWASEAHQVWVMDRSGRKLAEWSVEHSGSAIGAMADRLVELANGRPERIAVAIEIPRGAVVEMLLERGLAVFSINPKQLDRFRDRHSVAGAKDDSRDAFVLGNSLRTDQHCFRRVRLEDPLIIRLRELSRMEDDLKTERNRLANRLRDQLLRFYPQVLQLCGAADEPWVWSLLKIAPTPAAAQRLRARTVERLLREHRIRRVSAEEVLQRLQVPPLRVAAGVVEAATEHIASLRPRLALVQEQLDRCEKRIEALLQKLQSEEGSASEQREHRDVEIFLSMPGVGNVVAATVLAEASAALGERDYHALRTNGGIAPVTKQSGKSRLVLMRYGCNGRLRNAFHFWAKSAAQYDPASRTYYASLRSRGHSHGRALRSVADRLLRILLAMLRTNTVYDPNRMRPVPTGAPLEVTA
jgi:transposase